MKGPIVYKLCKGENMERETKIHEDESQGFVFHTFNVLFWVSWLTTIAKDPRHAASPFGANGGRSLHLGS